MPIYTYEAGDKDSKIVNGEYEANSKEEVVEYLSKHFLTPLSVKIVSGSAKNSMLSISLFEKVSSVDIVFLVRNLATTVKAGLSIVESLDILIKDAKKKLMKKILRSVGATIKNGQTLSSGFSSYQNYFPPIFIGMIKAGEVSGQLEKTLSELAKFLSKEYSLRSRIKSALIYPMILLIASFGVVLMMMIFVLPRLAKSFTASNVSLPWITKFFLSISAVLTWNLYVDGIVIILIVWFFMYFRRTKIGKRFFFSIASHIPVAKELIKKIAIVRFARTLGNLLGSGLSVVEALEIASESVDNVSYTKIIKKTIEDIKNGIPISQSIEKYPEHFPSIFISLMKVGERTGTLEEILITFADFYEEELDNTLKALTSVLEPVLLLIMGVMIGAIALSIILPIYQLVGHFV